MDLYISLVVVINLWERLVLIVGDVICRRNYNMLVFELLIFLMKIIN